MTLTGNTSFKTQWLYYNYSSETPGYESRLAPNSSKLMLPNKFSRPEGVTVDNFGNIYVADADRDSIYKFNSYGDELQSFGGRNIFKEPYSVAFFDKTLYVADKGNNRILRFILSTDLR
jgi:DNA-binding beta-propeller fold protein YncE